MLFYENSMSKSCFFDGDLLYLRCQICGNTQNTPRKYAV